MSTVRAFVVRVTQWLAQLTRACECPDEFMPKIFSIQGGQGVKATFATNSFGDFKL